MTKNESKNSLGRSAGSTGQQQSFVDECWEFAAPQSSGQHGATGQHGGGQTTLLPCEPELPQPGRGNRSDCDTSSCALPPRKPATPTQPESSPDIGPDDLPAYWRERYEERAAIREYEGGQAREHAEAEALGETIAQMREAGETP